MLPHPQCYWMITRPKYHSIYMIIYVKIKIYNNVFKKKHGVTNGTMIIPIVVFGSVLLVLCYEV